MDLLEIEEEIEKLENAETSYNNCMKLSVLYSIVDHHKKNITTNYSHSGSEFLLAVSGAPYDDVLTIIDEHMECLRVVYPKEYSSIINKIKGLES